MNVMNGILTTRGDSVVSHKDMAENHTSSRKWHKPNVKTGGNFQ